MRRFSSFLSPLFIVFMLSACEGKKEKTLQIGNLPWYTTMHEAFNLAQDEQKNVIVMVGEEYCKYCKRLKEKTLTDERVKERMGAYVRVSIKRSNKLSLKELPQFDGNIPSLFFMTKDKKVIDAIVGYYEPEDLLRLIDEVEEQ